MKTRIWLVPALVLCGMASLFGLGGCAGHMSDMHPGIKEGSSGDVALGIDRSAAFDYTVDADGNYLASSPIHIEKARGSQVFAESTAGVYYLAGSFEAGATGYRQIKGSWKVAQNVSGTVNNVVSGHTTSYNEMDHYGTVNVNGYHWVDVNQVPPQQP